MRTILLTIAAVSVLGFGGIALTNKPTPQKATVECCGGDPILECPPYCSKDKGPSKK